MSTIDDGGVILELIDNDGHYPDDPRVKEIALYLNRHNAWSVKISYRTGMFQGLLDDGFFTYLAWSSSGGVTSPGKELVTYLRKGGKLPMHPKEMR